MSGSYSADTSTASHPALEDAAEWFALLRSGEATDDDRRRWHVWLEANEENRAAWRFIERISDRFLPIQGSSDSHSAATAFRTAQTRLTQRRKILFGTLLTGVTGTLAWHIWRDTPVGHMALAWTADHYTRIGEVSNLKLPDGTQVWLGTATAFDNAYDQHLRCLKLLRGEILIQTATDAGRDFVVDSPHGRMRALGTRFTTRLEDGSTLLAVYQGAVEVRTHRATSSIVIKAGQQVRFTSTHLDDIVNVEPGREASARGIVIADNHSLKQVVQELERYYNGHISLDPAIADLPVFGSYPAYDLNRTLSMLNSVMPIEVHHPLPWWLSIRPEKKD